MQCRPSNCKTPINTITSKKSTDSHRGNIYKFQPSTMCVVKLSVLKGCGHELATIEYCGNTMSIWEYLEKPPQPGVELMIPKPCTNTLGWKIYQSLDVSQVSSKISTTVRLTNHQEPVTCKSCKDWLKKKDKETFGQSKAKLEEAIEELVEDSEDDKSVSGIATKEPPKASSPSPSMASALARMAANNITARVLGARAARRGGH